MTAGSPKISVVIPAYKPGAGLDRVIASLDGQTMPQDEFEIVIVDDGSPDDTFERLTEMRRTRPNMTIEKIAPSGWASRPRNVGTALASGEYILYMDSDDHLYPRALERCWEFAEEHGSDVLSPKESKTNAPWWGMDRWSTNRANIKDGHGIEGLLPMMPHKMYRRSFLLEHGITFPETTDGERVLWEDIWFNIEAYRHAKVVSVLSDTPVYRWHWTSGSISKSYGPRDEDFWLQLERLLEFIQTALADDPVSRDAMVLHQFRDRCLLRLSRAVAVATPEEIAMALSYARRIQEAHVPLALEAQLGKMERARGALLRAERPDLMRQLWEFDRTIRSRTTATSATWADGVLEVGLRTTLSDSAGVGIPFERRGDRVLRVVPPDVAAVLPDEVLDVTDDLAAVATSVWVRSRAERVTWAVPFESTPEFVPRDAGGLQLTCTSTARIDARTAAFGAPLDEPVWDLWAETRWLGTSARGGVQTQLPQIVSIANGVAAVAYRSRRGELALDLQQRMRSAVSDGGPIPSAASGTIAAFVLPLGGASVVGTSDIPLTIRLQPVDDTLRRGIEKGRVPGALTRLMTASIQGRLVADPSGARLEAGGPAPPGEFRMVFEVQPGSPVVTNLVMRVDRDTVAFSSRRITPSAGAVAGVASRLRASIEAGRILARTAVQPRHPRSPVG